MAEEEEEAGLRSCFGVCYSTKHAQVLMGLAAVVVLQASGISFWQVFVMPCCNGTVELVRERWPVLQRADLLQGAVAANGGAGG